MLESWGTKSTKTNNDYRRVTMTDEIKKDLYSDVYTALKAPAYTYTHRHLDMLVHVARKVAEDVIRVGDLLDVSFFDGHVQHWPADREEHASGYCPNYTRSVDAALLLCDVYKTQAEDPDHDRYNQDHFDLVQTSLKRISKIQNMHMNLFRGDITQELAHNICIVVMHKLKPKKVFQFCNLLNTLYPKDVSQSLKQSGIVEQICSQKKCEISGICQYDLDNEP